MQTGRRATLILATAVVAAVVAGCGAVGPTPDPAGPGEGAPVRAEAVDGPYRLTLELPRATWALNEPITGTAALTFAGPGVATLAGSGSGLVTFRYRSLDGGPDVQPATTDDCVPRELPAGSSIEMGLAKSGGWSADSPDAAFYQAFFSGPDVLLPAGAWTISAIATFDEGQCTATPVTLRATVEIRVTD